MKHIAIIGAGVLGGAIAWRLAEQGHRVTLYDPTPGGQASPGSLAWLNASFSQDPVYNRLRGDSLIAWEELSKAADPPPVRFPGAILWDQPHFDLDAILAEQEALARPARMLDRNEHLATEPNVQSPPDRALFCEGDGFGLPVEITGWFLDRARQAGADVVQATVDGLEVTGNRTTGIHVNGATDPVDAVILAAGIGLADLLAPLGIRLGMDNQPGLLVTTTPTRPLVSAMLATNGLHGWQGADGRFLIGADFGGGDAIGQPDDHAAALVERLGVLIPSAAKVEAERYTVRTRPMPADGRPAIGPIGPEGLYVVSTHSGMTLAPVIAEMVAKEVGSGASDPRLAPYRPGRDALR